MTASATEQMTDQRRALLTEREREILTGEADVTDNYRYSVESRIRSRIRERLREDVEVIREFYPEMFDSLLYPMVCQPDNGSTSDTPVAASPSSAEDLGEPDETWDAEPADSDPSSTDSAALSVLMDESVEEAVEKVASSWEDTDERLKKRKAAAGKVLQYALHEDEAVGKSSEIVADTQAAYPVEGQNEETYWRKNIRPVLSEYGEYNQGKHGYIVESLDG